MVDAVADGAVVLTLRGVGVKAACHHCATPTLHRYLVGKHARRCFRAKRPDVVRPSPVNGAGLEEESLRKQGPANNLK